MTKHLTTSDLPEPVARFAQAQIAAGRFSTVEDVLTAGVEALQEREKTAPLPHDWMDFLRHRFEEGRKAIERGEAVEMDDGQFDAFLEECVSDTARP